MNIAIIYSIDGDATCGALFQKHSYMKVAI